jgi:hypothetical protein
MNTLKVARQKAGLDNEEFWFYQKEQELIEKFKKSQLKLIKGGAELQGKESSSYLESASSQYQKGGSRKAA